MGATLAHFVTSGQEQLTGHQYSTRSFAAFLNPTRADTRVTPRHGAPVEIQVMGRGTPDVLDARNVSQTGVGIYVAHDFAGCDLDETVELVITLPYERPFLNQGTIKHQTEGAREGHHFGVHFSDLPADHLENIQNYVQSLTRA
ncbi:MAG TPA: PilZ domain-containing protein [Myxococcales bacterium]|nr:PilZ domain-containing protein [Myxococcales bacterium]HIK83929.1 PilZ domain-containing protein [Myxococcales bacterium]